MVPYNASDLIRAMRQDHGLILDPDRGGPTSRSRWNGGASGRFPLRRWFGAIATRITVH